MSAENADIYTARLNKAMEEMIEDGTIREIFSHYPDDEKMRNSVLLR